MELRTSFKWRTVKFKFISPAAIGIYPLGAFIPPLSQISHCIMYTYNNFGSGGAATMQLGLLNDFIDIIPVSGFAQWNTGGTSVGFLPCPMADQNTDPTLTGEITLTIAGAPITGGINGFIVTVFYQEGILL